MSTKKDQKIKEKETAKVQKDIVNELTDDPNDLDLIKVDLQGLVSIINEGRIDRFDLNDFDMADIIQNIIQKRSNFNSFFIMDIGAVFRRFKLWKKLLPQVEIFYAVKCNSDKILLKTLSFLNIGFDVASKVEISMIKELEIPNDLIIFANPVKEIDHITYARSLGVSLMTFDNEDELKKISVFHPTADLILRIAVDDSKSKMPFGSKFGCPTNNINDLFTLAKQLKLNLVGTSFHVGSRCMDPTAYSDAIKLAKEVFLKAEEFGYKFTILDIGGGFNGSDEDNEISFENISKSINDELEESFNGIENLRIIAEPGRFFAESCGTLVTNVIGKKQIKINEEEKMFHYYVNSNLYGMFNNIVFDHAKIKFQLLNKYQGKLYDSIIFGQTCDSMDKIAENIKFFELTCGDWVYSIFHGAYTLASASNFNGFNIAEVIYIYTY